MHENSAKNMKCIAAGSGTFTYSQDQYAGNLVCSGTPETKVYIINTCAQDIPPTLYAKMTNNLCCASPTTCANGTSTATKAYP